MSLSMIALCFVISSWSWRSEEVKRALSASATDVFAKGHLWKIFTTIFVHADGLHLISNSFMLFILGYFVFGYYGWKVHPFYSLLGAALTNIFALLTYSSDTRLVGASGWVYFLAGFWLCLYLFIERQKTLFSRWMRVFGVGLMILFPSSFEMQVSYRTHLIGLIVGILFAIFYYIKNKKRLLSYEAYKLEMDEPLIEDPMGESH